MLAEASDRIVNLPIFWAELGLVAPPFVLARLGSLLYDVAAEDKDIEEAIRCAVERVQHYPSGRLPTDISEEDHVLVEVATIDRYASPSSTPPSQHRDVSPAGWVKCTETDDMMSSEADSLEDEVMGIQVYQVLPLQPANVILPGMGPALMELGWMCVSIASFVHILYMRLRGTKEQFDSRWIHDDNGLSEAVERACGCVDVIAMFSCIPISFGIHKLFGSVAMKRFIWREMKLRSGAGLQTFLWCASGGSTLLFAIIFGMTPWWDLITPFGPRLSEVFSWLNYWVHLATFVFVFLLLWKTTRNEIRQLQERLELQGHLVTWEGLAQQYQETNELVDEVWRTGNFGMAVLGFLFATSLDALRCCIVALLNRDARTVRIMYVWGTIDAVLLIATMFLMASVSSACTSKLRSRKSVLTMAAQHYGRLPLAQRPDHNYFVQCVLNTPCGVELYPFGRITRQFAVIVCRVLIVVISASLSVASHTSRSDDLKS